MQKGNGRALRMEHGEERSITDYVITSQEYMETIRSIENDEEKQYGLYKIQHQNKQIKKTYYTMLY